MNETSQANPKAVRILIILVILIFIISLILTVVNYQQPKGKKVLVIQNHQILYEFYLESEPNQTIRIDFPDGGYNIIQIQNHEICISEADCPDLTCVHTGTLKSESMPVVCLPHKLIIRFAEEGEFS